MMILMTAFPWMVMSPVSVVLNLFSGDDVTTGSSAVSMINVIVVGVMVTASLIWFRQFRMFITKFALSEEMWFRAGSEKWSRGQKIYSCVAFSFAHVFNLIYPIGVLIVLVVTGAILMAVYLRVYKKTSDPYQAVLASARVHAAYNITVIYWVAGVIAGFSLLSLVGV